MSDGWEICMKKQVREQAAMMTRWGRAIDPEHVLDEYPRPEMVRESYLNLNGMWDYAITESEAFPQKYDGKILVPFSPEAPLSGVNRILQPGEYLHYEKQFTLCKENHVRYLLHFGAVDQICKVYVNGENAGEHTGGYLAFSLDITRLLRDGKNLIRVTVQDFSDTSFHAKGKQSLQRGGMWYTPQSGIWQSVWMEKVPVCHIRTLKITPDFDRKMVAVKVLLNTGEKLPLHLTVRYHGQTLLSTQAVTGSSFRIGPLPLHPWTPETPDLYDLAVQAGEDEVTSYFAMRKISVEKDENGIRRLFLNGSPYYQNGVLDQGYYPDGLYTAPSDDAMAHDILQMKHLGFNMLRKHMKIEPSRWYYHCDRLGMLVWQDMVCGGEPYHSWFVTIMPNVFPFTGRILNDRNRWLFSRTQETGRREYLREVKCTIRQLYHHPSIILWTAFNEGWGQFDAGKVTDMIRRADPSRLVEETSGWFDQGGGDLNSIHNYFRKLKISPDPHRCAALTEFGGYSWHIAGRSFNEKEYGYRKYHSKEDLTHGMETLWTRDLFGNIPVGLSASVYTQLSDIEDETNGLMTYDREEIKVDEERIRQANKKLGRVFASSCRKRSCNRIKRYRHTDRPGFLLGFIDFFTAGLFFLVYMPLGLQKEIESVLGHKVMPYWKAYLCGIPTFFIYPLIWMARISEDLKQKAVSLDVPGPYTSWRHMFGWNIFGLPLMGPAVATHRFFGTLNRVERELNRRAQDV